MSPASISWRYRDPALGSVVFIAAFGNENVAGFVYRICARLFVSGIPQAVFPAVYRPLPDQYHTASAILVVNGQ